VVHQDPKLTIVAGDGHVTVLYTDKRRDKDGSQEIQTRWDGNRIVIERRFSDSISLVETYEVRPVQQRLVVNKRMVTSIMGEDRTVSVRCVYDLSVSAGDNTPRSWTGPCEPRSLQSQEHNAVGGIAQDFGDRVPQP
jgi:hypothetical protein